MRGAEACFKKSSPRGVPEKRQRKGHLKKKKEFEDALI